jgi:hypothetical protein
MLPLSAGSHHRYVLQPECPFFAWSLSTPRATLTQSMIGLLTDVVAAGGDDAVGVAHIPVRVLAASG